MLQNGKTDVDSNKYLFLASEQYQADARNKSAMIIIDIFRKE